jgi:flagellar protein FliO/FliZ
METVGNGMIIEVLPPTLNKAEAPAVTDAVAGKAIGQSSGQIAGEPSLPVANGDTIKTEKEIPLFSKKEANPAESSGMTKIAFMVFAIVALGGYMLWSMKNRSKMVNGPESLMKIKVITQFHLGPKKTLAVVRVAGESLLLGITESQISLIKTLSLLDEDLPEVGAGTFAAALGEQTEPSRKTHVESEIENVAEEEFAFGPAVKTTLSQKIPMLRRII